MPINANNHVTTPIEERLAARRLNGGEDCKVGPFIRLITSRRWRFARKLLQMRRFTGRGAADIASAVGTASRQLRKTPKESPTCVPAISRSITAGEDGTTQQRLGCCGFLKPDLGPVPCRLRRQLPWRGPNRPPESPG